MPSSNMHQMDQAEPNVGICAVCGDRADGYHYGVLSCRGCNAFFRRAVAFNLQFHCRRDGHCEINKNARCACRACRLHKCRTVGMDSSAVQVRREVKDVLGLNYKQENNVEIIGTEILQSSFSDLLSAQVFGSAKILDSPQLKSRLLGSMNSLANCPNSPAIVHPIDRLIEWYFCQRYRRNSMLSQTVEQILNSMTGQQSGLSHQITPEELSQINKVQMILMFEWVEQLEVFDQLENPFEKTHLLRAYAPKYLLLDIIFYTLEQGFSDRIVYPNGSYIYRGHLLLPKMSPSNGRTDREIAYFTSMEMIYGEEHLNLIEDLIEPMMDLEITFGEFIALRLFLLWDSDAAVLDYDSYKQLVNTDLMRQQVERTFSELQAWYELHSLATEDRLSTLLQFLPVFKKSAEHFSRIMENIPDFDVTEWQFISDLLMRK